MLKRGDLGQHLQAPVKDGHEHQERIGDLSLTLSDRSAKSRSCSIAHLSPHR